MYDDILGQRKPKKQIESWSPSYIEINYFKDGEGYEDFVTISADELLGALPLFMPISDEETVEYFVEKVKEHELIRKCLQSQRNLI